MSSRPSEPTANSLSAGDADGELLKKAAGGDGEAFARLAERHVEGLFRLAYSLVGNRSDAEDVLQEAMLGAYQGAKNFEGRSSVRTWLGQIVARQAAANRRSRKVRKTVGLSAESEGMSSGAGGEAEFEAREDVGQVMAQLTPEYREVVVLRELGNMSYEEIATALGLPRGTVESRLHRGRAELRELLAGQGYGVAEEEGK